MIVTFYNFSQYTAALAAASERHLHYLEQGEVFVNGKRRCAMPAAGWRNLFQALQPRAFNRFGERSSKARPGTMGATRRIALALASHEAHPAFNEVAVPRYDQTVLVGFLGPAGVPSPYPPGRLVVFEPERLDGTSLDWGNGPQAADGFTVWRPREPNDFDRDVLEFLDVADHADW